jgi:hypothetical protein
MQLSEVAVVVSISLHPFEARRFIGCALSTYQLRRQEVSRPDGIFVAPFEQGEIGPDSLQHGAGGDGIETKRSTLPRRPVEGLDQGEKPKASGDVARHGSVLMTSGPRAAADRTPSP